MSLVELPNGSKLYVESRGLATAHAIVFVHSVGADRRMWDPLLDVKPNELNRNSGSSCLSPIVNIPLSVESHAQDLDLLIRHLNLESPSIVGHSLGSFVSAEYAVGDQGSISQLLLISSLLSPRAKPARAAQKKTVAKIREAQSVEPVVESSIQALVGQPSTNALALSYSCVLMLAQSPDGYASNLAASSDFDEHIEVEKLEIPVLVINGGRDFIAGDGSRLSQAIRG
ncbi:hypothetical protein BS47DRAFT_1386320 [Hydnum rufescens UP504]|uniref:AB hydrolase-1 domain-containing protein n=1 Tax=Hydnum rufescens UP504 TaxID=1448309 RepID=A0A9P6AF42_9AGAM|nr:hypothetical protein BS47DRAFT_1386320 [Hydnum rufescens UP504]